MAVNHCSVLYYTEMLLCMYLQGNNKKCIEALSKHVTFEQAIWCVHRHCPSGHSGPRLHPSLVSKYVELIKGDSI